MKISIWRYTSKILHYQDTCRETGASDKVTRNTQVLRMNKLQRLCNSSDIDSKSGPEYCKGFGMSLKKWLHIKC